MRVSSRLSRLKPAIANANSFVSFAGIGLVWQRTVGQAAFGTLVWIYVGGCG